MGDIATKIGERTAPFEMAPSILSADFARLGEEIAAVEKGGATVLHVDVMDGKFVPNITIGLPVVKSLRKCTRVKIDTHLMIEEPGRYAAEFVKAGADMVSVHIEADPHIHRTLASIKSEGALAGVVINPATPISALDEVLNYADFVLVMSVNPGFGGQKFIPPVLEKLRRLKEIVRERGLDTLLEIDGGVDQQNIAEIVSAGADIVVAGSAVFGKGDPAAAVKELLDGGSDWV
ncbi:MAG: ribulose-phosphate 3-epimerase [Acidobacteria bacterium]|nr:ribulose-phosphate 3-epimerase [Acidobacteriota bacterium]